MYILVCFIPIQYSTWCQNRGCICISSTRRTYRIQSSSFLHTPVIQTSIIILQTELFLHKEGKERFQYIYSAFEYSVFYSRSSASTWNSTSFQSSHARKTILHIKLILLQEFSKKYFNYKAHPMQADTRHPPTTVPHASKHSTLQKPSQGDQGDPIRTPRLPVILPTETAF